MTAAASIAAQVRELWTLPSTQLATRYEELFGRPPRVRNVAWLRRQVAWKLQERALGGLTDRARARLGDLIAGIDLPLRDAPPPRPRALSRTSPRDPIVGTVLVRRWRDQDLRVEVREDGVVWNGTVYSSLSAAAKAITGSSWNGRLFFGLTQRSTSR